MNASERHQRILELMQLHYSVTNEHLQREFDVTKETIRKDLNSLAEKGLIVRTFGGAILRKDEYDPSIEQRTTSNLEEKREIAKAAFHLIQPNDVIATDSGSTTLELANLITGKEELVVLTNSLKVLNVLAKRAGITAIGTGGILRARSLSFQGAAAESTVCTYNIRKAFISAKAFHMDNGIMDSNEEEAAVKRAMLKNAQETTLLMDHTKFTRMAHVTICPINGVHRIITSALADALIVHRIRQAGIEVLTVPFACNASESNPQLNGD